LGRKNSRSFPNGIAKVHFIFELANFFSTFFKKTKRILQPLTPEKIKRIDSNNVNEK